MLKLVTEKYILATLKQMKTSAGKSLAFVVSPLENYLHKSKIEMDRR